MKIVHTDSPRRREEGTRKPNFRRERFKNIQRDSRKTFCCVIVITLLHYDI